VCLDDETSMELLSVVCERLAQGNVPQTIIDAMHMSSLTALQKNNGTVRGVAAGRTSRRLVGEGLAKQFQQDFRSAVAPAHFGLCDRSGTDALAHVLRATSEASPSMAITCLDGVGAFDLVLRVRFFEELLRHPTLQNLAPHVHLWYGRRSRLVWADDHGDAQLVEQREGGEHGDPWMPGLFALAIKPALDATQHELLEGKAVCLLALATSTF
jgi:hypothetical protein